MTYLAHLAARVPDKKLRDEIRKARAVAGLAAAVCGVAVVVSFAPLLGCVTALSFLATAAATVVFLVKYADQIDRLRKHLDRLLLEQPEQI